MKAMLTGFAALIVIGVGAWYGLSQAGFSSQQVYSGANVRLD
ncbi:hypothetical protein [Pseudoprimorskyibacter insulae]|uniref:Uncharacterized protein n=1 Tax=Pseudoprimorskyibacter insulae TaxID=1695997 RepID=A0A2R8B093_9RHOB|nr:hypothetical protein [Pseudoprimorskyibacter insulae]SPF81688.1 hypothetical protein PRI8871_03513 [Pseudoprimorskyibacter insulae]